MVTSYDYDAPLSEAGDPTEKLFAIRDVIKLVLSINPPPSELAVPFTPTRYVFESNESLFPCSSEMSPLAPCLLLPPSLPMVSST